MNQQQGDRKARCVSRPRRVAKPGWEEVPDALLRVADGGYGGEGGSFHAVGFEWEYFECKQETATRSGVT